MVIRRFVYIFTLVGVTIFFVLYHFWFAWYLLVLTLLLAPFDLVISLPGMLARRAMLRAPNVLAQGDDATLAITTLQLNPLPARCLKIWLRVTCDDFSTTKRIICGAQRGNRYEIEIDTTRTGVTVFRLKRIWAVSLIGLFSLPVTVNCRASVLILPAPKKPPHTVALPRGVILRPKPGGGFAEDYDMRQYRPGDPIKSVHWKVSAKFDSLIIREPLVPPAHSRLIQVEQWAGAEERDLTLGHLLWVSDYLLKWELPYYIKFGDDGPIAEIKRPADLTDYLYRVLDGAAQTVIQATPPIRFAWIYKADARE